MSTHSHTLRRRTVRSLALAAVVLTAASCGQPTTTNPGPRIRVTSSIVDVAPGTTVTVKGLGYQPGANIGTRPPFAGQPAGVYVVFGRFAETWRPSEGEPASARQIIQQVWALPQAQHDALDPDGSNPAIVLMAADGTFTAQLQLNEAEGTGDYAIATYPGSGAVNASEEVLRPVSFLTAAE